MARIHIRRKSDSRRRLRPARTGRSHKAKSLARGTPAAGRKTVRGRGSNAARRQGSRTVRGRAGLRHARRGTHFGLPHHRRKQRFGLKHHRRTTRFHRKFRVTHRIRLRKHTWR